VAEKSIKLNAAMNVIRIISSMIFPLITFPYVSRILGPEGTGKVSFANSFVSYFIMLASIGIPMYGIREIARVRANKELLSATAQELFVMNFVVSVVVFLGFIGLIFLNGKLHDEKTLFFIVSFSIILTSIGMDWLYQGLEEYTYITVRSLIFSFISVIAIFIFIHHKENYLIYGAIGVFASLGSSVLNFYKARKIIFARRVTPWNFKRHVKPLIVVYIMSFIISIYIQLDTVMLGFMSTAKNVGYYASAIKLTKMLLALVTSLGTVLLPRLSFYIANNRRNEFDELIKKSFAIIILLCLPIVAALMMLSKDVIIVLAGVQYLPAASCMIITAPIILFIGLTNIFGIQILYPLGKDKSVVASVAVGALISFVLNLLLIPRLAHIGAAIATLAAEFGVLVIQIVMIAKVHPMKVPIRKYIVATIGLVLLLSGIKIEITHLWVQLAIAIPTSIVLYFGMLILMKESLVGEITIKLKERFIHV
jgi:O-antigen/teichoic acid export membrane protein